MDNPDKITFAIIMSENLHMRLWIRLTDWPLLELFCETQIQFMSCPHMVSGINYFIPHRKAQPIKTVIDLLS